MMRNIENRTLCIAVYQATTEGITQLKEHHFGIPVPGLYDDLSCLQLAGHSTIGYSMRLHSLLTFTP